MRSTHARCPASTPPSPVPAAALPTPAGDVRAGRIHAGDVFEVVARQGQWLAVAAPLCERRWIPVALLHKDGSVEPTASPLLELAARAPAGPKQASRRHSSSTSPLTARVGSERGGALPGRASLTVITALLLRRSSFQQRQLSIAEGCSTAARREVTAAQIPRVPRGSGGCLWPRLSLHCRCSACTPRRCARARRTRPRQQSHRRARNRSIRSRSWRAGRACWRSRRPSLRCATVSSQLARRVQHLFHEHGDDFEALARVVEGQYIDGTGRFLESEAGRPVVLPS